MSDEDFEKMMGFASFGAKKEAKKFNFMEMFEKAHATAKERNESSNIKAKQELDEIIMKEKNNKSNEILKEKKDNELLAADDSDVEDEEDEDPFFIPHKNHINLRHGTKQITAVAVDPAGARIVTAGLEFDVKLWDFAGMDSDCRSFKVCRPCDDHQMKVMEFSPNGDVILLISGSAQAHIVSRDGELKAFCNKGYQYITDPAAAKGHTHALTGGAYHPIDGNTFLTSSLDTTLRVWSMDNTETLMGETRITNHKSVIKPRNALGRKIPPMCCAYSKDGMYIAAACQDGSLQLWDTRRPYVNTTAVVRTAFPSGTEATGLCFSWDGRQLAARAMDDTLRLFDMRAMTNSSSAPVTGARRANSGYAGDASCMLACVRDLPVFYAQTQVAFGPNDHVLVTGVAAPRNEPDNGRLAFFQRGDLKPLLDVQPGHGHVNCVTWHPRIGQVFCGSGNGTVSVYYDAERGATRGLGAAQCAARQATAASRRRRAGLGEAFVQPTLLFYDEDSLNIARKTKKGRQATLDALSAPTAAAAEQLVALAAVHAEWGVARQAELERTSKEMYARNRAKLPDKAGAEDKTNKVGSLHQFMVQQIVLRPNGADERAEKDIRGAILRHAEDAAKRPFWTKAYNKTQPNAVFLDPADEVKTDETPTWKKQKLA